MKSLFDKENFDEINRRLNTLTPSSPRQWGKMDVAQMLAHCKAAFRVPLSEHPMKRSMLGLLVGWMIKQKLYNDDPWKKNLPTAPEFRITNQKDFEKERMELAMLIHTFYTRGKGNVGKYPHPMFGSFTQDQWGQAMYKHLDHHFRQFGV
ncbi:MAG TPA: DUF1569 domain-containing protein [Ferruginibacter sp.]|nr:DUF1569 domain-containing protein [Ferruginibacter sp.]